MNNPTGDIGVFAIIFVQGTGQEGNCDAKIYINGILKSENSATGTNGYGVEADWVP